MDLRTKEMGDSKLNDNTVTDSSRCFKHSYIQLKGNYFNKALIFTGFSGQCKKHVQLLCRRDEL